MSARQRAGIVTLLVGSALLCLLVAPLVMPDSYSMVRHAVSESAGQGVEYAWVARLGFVFLGFGVLLLAGHMRSRWGRLGQAAHRVYGLSMIMAAVYAHAPWEPGPFVEFEDTLHSLAAYAVGLSFTVGVLLVWYRRERQQIAHRVFDALAVMAAIVIPMTMFNVTGVAGLVQRLMFAIGYAWYLAEVFTPAPGDAEPGPRQLQVGAAAGRVKAGAARSPT